MYSMKEACKMAGLSYDTLKYYCNEGLVPNVKRDKNNYRVFDDKDISWIANLICLKKCRMSIKNMKTYLDYCLKGKESIPNRKEMLEKQKEILLNEVKDINEHINYINHKQQFYDDVLNEKIQYYSNLIQFETKEND